MTRQPLQLAAAVGALAIDEVPGGRVDRRRPVELTKDRVLRGPEAFREDADATPLFKGLPDDRCQSPHWGYVVAGKVTFRYAEREEVYEGGDAYYAPPGHIPVVTAGTEVIEFSPTAEYGRTMEVLSRNLAAAQAG